MMKNLRKNLIIFLVMILAFILLFVNGSNASQFLLTGNDTTGNATTITNSSSNSQTTNTQTTNPPTTNTQTSNSAGNVQKVNTVSNGSKDPQSTDEPQQGGGDLPQTGENDIYIITAVGAVAIVIGGIAYIKSRKYDIK